MKNSFTSVFIVLLITATAIAGAFLEQFSGRTEGDNIRLEWKTGEEVNLKEYVIERKTPQTSFVEITSMAPKGSNSFYSFVDENAYKTTDMLFIYRLKIVDGNNQATYSNEISVTPQISDVKRTWGSIKAMFR